MDFPTRPTYLGPSALPATATGRAMLADAYFDRATMLAKFNVGMVFDDGAPSVGTFRLTGATLNGEAVTVGARSYVFTGGAAGASITALVAAVNGDASREADALDLAGDACGFLSLTKPGLIALSTTCVNGVVSDIGLVSGSVSTFRIQSRGRFSINPEHVAAWVAGGAVVVGGVAAATMPTLEGFLVQAAAPVGGQFKNLTTGVVGATWIQFNANYYGLVVTDSGGILADTDTITWTAHVA